MNALLLRCAVVSVYLEVVCVALLSFSKFMQACYRIQRVFSYLCNAQSGSYVIMLHILVEAFNRMNLSETFN